MVKQEAIWSWRGSQSLNEPVNHILREVSRLLMMVVYSGIDRATFGQSVPWRFTLFLLPLYWGQSYSNLAWMKTKSDIVTAPTASQTLQAWQAGRWCCESWPHNCVHTIPVMAQTVLCARVGTHLTRTLDNWIDVGMHFATSFLFNSYDSLIRLGSRFLIIFSTS